MNYYEITMERSFMGIERATITVAARSLEEAVLSAYEASPEWEAERQTPGTPEVTNIERIDPV